MRMALLLNILTGKLWKNLILSTNESKYHQTEGCGSQLMDDDFVNLFGSHGEGPRVIDVILLGDVDLPAHTSEATRDFLNACKSDLTSFPAPLTNIAVRFNNHRSSWKIRKEKSLSYNEHIGHYKAIMKDDFLSWLFFQRADFASISGYSPSRHRKCIDLMILKKSQSSNITKQRTLGILDTEFNQLNKSLGRDAMFAALDCSAIADEQFCRPGNVLLIKSY